MATQKQRNYEAHGRKAEIIGPTTRCMVFIDGASHPSFSKTFRSIRAARISFMRWADAVNRCYVAKQPDTRINGYNVEFLGAQRARVGEDY